MLKVLSQETKALINRMFSMSLKERVFEHLLEIFMSNVFSCKVTYFSNKLLKTQVVYL